jgi:DNA primase
MEGFCDCLKLHQAGVPAVVALMGAALSDSQQRALLEHFRNA